MEKETMTTAYKYFAFISYNSHDLKWGKRLQRKLESYRLPTTLCTQHHIARKPMRPVFFAPTDIQPAGLSEELQKRLRDSRHLIVICSPKSAQSEWVGREIEYFHSLGRKANMHFFIVEGIPHSGDKETECFNPILEQLGVPEILGANIHERIYRRPWLNRRRAYIQLITKLLGIEFDTLWQREKRRMKQQVAMWFISATVVLSALGLIWRLNLPVDVKINLNEVPVHNPRLPKAVEIVVSLTLDNEVKTDTTASIDQTLVFANIPRRMIGKTVRLTVNSYHYLPVDTTLPLAESIEMNVCYNPSLFGDIRFRLWNPDEECFVPNCRISVGGHEVVTNESGSVAFFVPLAAQDSLYHLSADVPLLDEYFKPSPVPIIIETAPH